MYYNNIMFINNINLYEKKIFNIPLMYWRRCRIRLFWDSNLCCWAGDVAAGAIFWLKTMLYGWRRCRRRFFCCQKFNLGHFPILLCLCFCLSLLLYSKNKLLATTLLIPLSENHDFDFVQLGHHGSLPPLGS